MRPIYDNRRLLVIAVAIVLCGSPMGSSAKEPQQSLDVDQVVKSCVASLEALRSKPLRIKSERTLKQLAGQPKFSQTLLIDGRNVRLETRSPSMHSQTCILDNHWLMAVNDRRAEQLRLRSCLVMPDDRYNRTIARLEGADYLGFPKVFWRGKIHDLVQVLPKLRLAARHDTLDGMDVILLEGNSEDIGLKLWTAPSSGYALRKVEYRPTVPDKLTDENIDRIPSHSLYTAEFSQFQKVGDHYFPQKIQIHYVTVPCVVREGKVLPNRSIDASFEVTWICEIPKTISKDDLKITMDIPDGTPVSMEDARQVEYVWHDGKVVEKK